jgi:phage-related minor tail protein
VAAAPFDTLKLARALRDRAGFSQEHAEAAADALADAVSEQVATKQDLGDLRGEMQAEFAALRAEMQAEFAAMRAEMQAEFAAVRGEIAALRSDMVSGFRDIEQRMIIKLGGMLVVLAGILLAAKIFG